jgi:hypothetical protein
MAWRDAAAFCSTAATTAAGTVADPVAQLLADQAAVGVQVDRPVLVDLTPPGRPGEAALTHHLNGLQRDPSHCAAAGT